MSLYKFNEEDIFRSFIETYPKNKFFIYEGERWWNDNPSISGAFTGNIESKPGYISLYGLNIDRSSEAHTWNADTQSGNKSLIFPYTEKTNNSYNSTFKSISTGSFFGKKPTIDSQGNFILPQITSSYPLSSSISVLYYATNQSKLNSPVRSLKNITRYYKRLSPQFEYSSSNRNFESASLTLINIPTIFYQSQIHKGSVKLEFYISGNLVSRLQDLYKNGELRSTYLTSSTNTGSVEGLVYYNEGVILLTGSNALTAHTEDYVGTGNTTPKWIYFGSTLSGNSTPSSSYVLEFEGVNTIPVLNMYTHARKFELNHSNNPTYLSYGQQSTFTTNSVSYKENIDRTIKNVVSSNYLDPTGSFEKTTYVSRITIYDQNKNPIAYAKLSKPIKKTYEKEFSIKLSLDL